MPNSRRHGWARCWEWWRRSWEPWWSMTSTSTGSYLKPKSENVGSARPSLISYSSTCSIDYSESIRRSLLMAVLRNWYPLGSTWRRSAWRSLRVRHLLLTVQVLFNPIVAATAARKRCQRTRAKNCRKRKFKDGSSSCLIYNKTSSYLNRSAARMK